jgi:hypothetical protein
MMLKAAGIPIYRYDFCGLLVEIHFSPFLNDIDASLNYVTPRPTAFLNHALFFSNPCNAA